MLACQVDHLEQGRNHRLQGCHLARRSNGVIVGRIEEQNRCHSGLVGPALDEIASFEVVQYNSCLGLLESKLRGELLEVEEALAVSRAFEERGSLVEC